jgi:hypothetical protein
MILPLKGVGPQNNPAPVLHLEAKLRISALRLYHWPVVPVLADWQGGRTVTLIIFQEVGREGKKNKSLVGEIADTWSVYLRGVESGGVVLCFIQEMECLDSGRRGRRDVRWGRLFLYHKV